MLARHWSKNSVGCSFYKISLFGHLSERGDRREMGDRKDGECSGKDEIKGKLILCLSDISTY